MVGMSWILHALVRPISVQEATAPTTPGPFYRHSQQPHTEELYAVVVFTKLLEACDRRSACGDVAGPSDAAEGRNNSVYRQIERRC